MPAWMYVALFAVRLYLKDGTWQTTREYEVKSDRIRFYSTERGDWEELPLEMVDLKKTKAEEVSKEETRKADRAANADEDRAIRRQQREVAAVPPGTGAYWLNGDVLPALKQAESKVNTSRRRTVWKALSPIPLVAGKATLEIDGLTSPFVVDQARPEFYMRLAKEEQFGIVRLNTNKGNRLVEKWTIVPVSKELVQERETVEIFQLQAEDGLYKIWPQKPLSPGEYAIIEFIEGKGNTQIWDFRLELKQ